MNVKFLIARVTRELDIIRRGISQEVSLISNVPVRGNFSGNIQELLVLTNAEVINSDRV